MKNVCNTGVDRISALPNSIISKFILKFLPLRDAVRTSILSTSWRFLWAALPNLIFDEDNKNIALCGKPELFARHICDILLLHHGPILKFAIDIETRISCLDIDRIMIFLSRNGIEDLTLRMGKDDEGPSHKLGSYSYTCQQQLKYLTLKHFEFNPPLRSRFSNLVSLELLEVELSSFVYIANYPSLERLTLDCTNNITVLVIDTPKLKYLDFEGHVDIILNIRTPLLEELRMYYTNGDEVITFDMIEFLCSAPLIRSLDLDYVFLKLLATKDNMAKQKLPSMLYSLKGLELTDIQFDKLDEHTSAICLIWSSPNLEELKIEVFEAEETLKIGPLHQSYWTTQKSSSVLWNKLRLVEIKLFSGSKHELEFIKLILASSPELTTIHITHGSNETDESRHKMLIELARFPRASRKAELLFNEQLPDDDENSE